MSNEGNKIRNSTSNLYEFIEAAARSRKYPENTAAGMKVALRLFEGELNDEEKGSVETLKKNLDRIYHAVFEKNKTKYAAGSLDVYRKRVSKLINDYLNYGTDPAKMNSWSPSIRKVTPRKQADKPKADIKPSEASNPPVQDSELNNPSGTRIEWPLSNDRKVVLVLPPDLTADEADTVKELIRLRVPKESKNEG